MKLIPDPDGKYVCYDEEIYTKQRGWYKTGKRLCEKLSFWDQDPEITMMELYENNLNPIRMSLTGLLKTLRDR